MNKHKITRTQFRTIVLLLLMLLAEFQYQQVLAQEPIPDTLVKERIQYIQRMLDEGKPAASLWWNGWLYGYSVATVGQGAVFLTADKLKTRQDMALGAVTTVIGAAGQLLMPMTPVNAQKKLTLIPGDTPEQRIIKLRMAEDLFKASAQSETDGKSWKLHAASGVVNLSGGLITWIGFKRDIWAGIGNFVLNTAICEAQILTQPSRAIRDYKRYSEKYANGLPQASTRQDIHFIVSAFPGGICMRMIF